MGKIFGIGLSKTGTTSLRNALNKLGIPALQWTSKIRILLRVNPQNGRNLLHPLDQEFQAFMDAPIFEVGVYARLDLQYPGSKFILTVRDREAWLVSQMRYFGRRLEQIETRQEDHIRTVMRFFKNRPQDLLIYNLCAGEGWQPLCKFLERPVPDTPFPHANKAKG